MFPYLDSERARIAEVPAGVAPGLSVLNYSLDQFLSRQANSSDETSRSPPTSTVMRESTSSWTGMNRPRPRTDWPAPTTGGGSSTSPPLEGTMRARRATRVTASMSPFQALYWGDIYDGVIFEPSYGARWQPYRDAYDGGMRPTFHNDGYVAAAALAEHPERGDSGAAPRARSMPPIRP